MTSKALKAIWFDRERAVQDIKVKVTVERRMSGEMAEGYGVERLRGTQWRADGTEVAMNGQGA